MTTRVNPTTHLTEYLTISGDWLPVASPRVARAEGLSADRRRTLQRTALLARGIHPTTKLRLLDEGWGRTCGDCDHHHAYDYHSRIFHKCDKVEMTHGPATDVRVGWPACSAFRESA